MTLLKISNYNKKVMFLNDMCKPTVDFIHLLFTASPCNDDFTSVKTQH